MPTCFWQDKVRAIETGCDEPVGPSIPASGLFIQREELIGPRDNASDTDRFGEYVAIDAETAMVSFWDEASGKYLVRTYIRNELDESWTYGQTLSATYDLFVQSISGEWAVFTYYNSVDSKGGIYIFKRVSGVWAQAFDFELPDAGAEDNLAQEACISPSGEWLIVGVYRQSDFSNNAGYAEVYRLTAATWAHSSTITSPSGVTSWKRFGTYLDVSDSKAIIGERSSNVSYTNGGRAHIYSVSGSTWSLEQTIQAPSPVSGEYFGTGVSIDSAGERVTVGGQKGKAYVFELSGTWGHIQTFDTVGNDTNKPTISGDGLTVVYLHDYYGDDMSIFVNEDDGGFSEEQEIFPDHPDQVGNWIGVVDYKLRDGQLIANAHKFSGGNPTEDGYVFIYSRDPV